MILDNTTESLAVTTSAAGTIDVTVAFVEYDATTTTPLNQTVAITTATTTTVLASPAASKQRHVKHLAIRNKGTSRVTVTVAMVDGATTYECYAKALVPGASLFYDEKGGWKPVNSDGTPEVSQTQQSPQIARTYAIYKVGTAAEAAGVDYCFGKDTGFPGAWSPGTPGLSGRATDGTTVADSGCVPLVAPGSGKTRVLQSFGGSATQVAQFRMVDVLWVNSGLVVTTTTAQALAPVAIPARDQNNTANGDGCLAGILVTASTTNAAAVTTITISYTNSAGVAGRTGTIPSFAATAVVGSVFWFTLQAGDVGVRSIDSITLGTSLLTGTISLIIARWYGGAGNVATNFPATPLDSSGVEIPAGATLLLSSIPAGATACTANLQLTTKDI